MKAIKKCTKCGNTYGIESDNFYKHKGTKDGLYPSCKDCFKKVSSQSKKKYKSVKTQVRCIQCSIEYYKRKSTVKANGENWCSPLCASKFKFFKKYGEGFEFTYHYNSSKKRARKMGFEFTLTHSYLSNIYKKQKGKCALSNIKMIPNGAKVKKGIFNASLDRIDNTKGYTKGNVQFVCLGINYMKNNFSDTAVISLLNKLR